MLPGSSLLRFAGQKPQVQRADLSYRVPLACTVLCCLNGVKEQERFMGARFFRLVAVALLLDAGFSVVVGGQSAPVGDASKPLTVEGALNLRTVADLQFSNDGARLAFVVTEPAKGTGRLRHIWIYDPASGMARQVTFSAKSELAPRFSPEPSAGSRAHAGGLTGGGERLAFLSDREEGQQQI